MNDFTNNIHLRLRELLHPLIVGYLARTDELVKEPTEDEVSKLKNILIEDILEIFREEKERYQKQQTIKENQEGSE